MGRVNGHRALWILAALGGLLSANGCLQEMDFGWTTTSGLACTPGTQRACYTGPAGTDGQGICKAGVETCLPDGSVYGACVGEQLPEAESCATPIDEDCDGVAPACEGLCLWALALGDMEDQAAVRIAVDETGRVFGAGTFSGSLALGDQKEVSAAGGDVFVAQLSAEGAPGWLRAFHGEGLRTVKALAVDDTGAVLVAGLFTGTADFGSGDVTSGGTSGFIVKLGAADGGYLWSKTFGTTLQDLACAVDPAGDVLLAGSFSGDVDLGTGVLTGNSGDVLIAKLQGKDGSALWSEKFGDDGTQRATEVVVNSEGEVVVLGAFTGTIDFGLGQLSSPGPFTTFAARVSGEDGSPVWSKAFGDSTSHPAHRAAVNAAGEMWIVEPFSGTADFGSGPMESNAFAVDLAVGKIRMEDGAPLWSRSFGTIGDQPVAARADSAGNLLLTGAFLGVIDFGDVPGNNTLASIGVDVFVAKLSPEGEHIWSKRIGDPENQPTTQACHDVALDTDDNVLIAGRFEAAISLGCGELTSAGKSDAFVAKLGP